jgi:hypothetical protein
MKMVDYGSLNVNPRPSTPTTLPIGTTTFAGSRF